MSTPNPVDQAKATAQAEADKAVAWLKKWYYQFGIGFIAGFILGKFVF